MQSRQQASRKVSLPLPASRIRDYRDARAQKFSHEGLVMSKLNSGFVRGLFAGAVSFIAMSANAADMYRAPEGVSYKDGPVYAPAWTGFYAGVNGGYGWSADDSKVTSGYLPFNPPLLGAKSFTTDGGFGGGQIGYNWQPASSSGYKDALGLGHLVFGVEADIQGAGIDGSAVSSVTNFGGATAKGTNDLDWFGTVRGRAGYAWGPTLAYFTGGLAFGGVKDTLSLTSTGSSSKTVSSNTTDTGYVLGGGVEHLFNPKWSVKVEYQYIDLGSDKLSATIPNIAIGTLDAEHKYNTVRLGVNYHFLPGYEPLK
jgi:outer membrane immunogenic protein